MTYRPSRPNPRAFELPASLPRERVCERTSDSTDALIVEMKMAGRIPPAGHRCNENSDFVRLSWANVRNQPRNEDGTYFAAQAFP